MSERNSKSLATNAKEDSVEALTGGTAYVDGKVVPLSEAKISMLDWGFLHSDATYDVMHVWSGRFFRLQDHLDRFEHGMKQLRMKIPYDRSQIESILKECVISAGLDNAYVEVVCTRGVPPPGSRDPRQCTNRFYAFVMPFTWIATRQQQERGLRMHVSTVHRIAPEAVDPTVKNYHWLDLIRGLFEAYDHGDETTALTDGRGNVVEGPGFNIFAFVNDVLITPGSGVLEGITRKTTIEIATGMGLNLQQRDLPIGELMQAQEIFVTSTAGGVMPVGWINGKSVSVGTADSVTSRIRDRYWEMHTDPSCSVAVVDLVPGRPALTRVDI
ncbi:aminotransferase class IV [Paraburkholderia sp.]|uniref:aminotransferase class IV n=1 Tax=Paraburkholderia sp. TaxID=1926495 RepID=UPI003D700348